MLIKAIENGFHHFTSSIGNVTGIISMNGKNLAIYEWTSHEPGQGNSLEALHELKMIFPFIEVVGIGSQPEDPSWQYWKRMAEKNYANRLLDDEGQEVYVPPLPELIKPARPTTVRNKDFLTGAALEDWKDDISSAQMSRRLRAIQNGAHMLTDEQIDTLLQDPNYVIRMSLPLNPDTPLNERHIDTLFHDSNTEVTEYAIRHRKFEPTAERVALCLANEAKLRILVCRKDYFPDELTTEFIMNHPNLKLRENLFRRDEVHIPMDLLNKQFDIDEFMFPNFLIITRPDYTPDEEQIIRLLSHKKENIRNEMIARCENEQTIISRENLAKLNAIVSAETNLRKKEYLMALKARSEAAAMDSKFNPNPKTNQKKGVSSL